MIKDDIPAHFRLVHISRRRIFGRLWNGGKQRGFFKIQVLKRFTEIRPSARLESICPGTEKYIIHVHLKDLILCVEAFDLQSDCPFIHLASVGLVFIEEKILGKLLRDRGRAFHFTGDEILHHRANDPIRIDADVVVEPVIFDSEQGILHVRRHVLDLDRNAFFDREFGKHGFAVIGIDRGNLRRPICGQCRHLDRITRVVKVI